jgi:hypothetical protein
MNPDQFLPAHTSTITVTIQKIFLSNQSTSATMAIDLVAILTATPGKEAELETAMNSLANNVKSGEPKTERYKLYKRINSDEGQTELVVIER